jgi:hypothetical protein
MRVAITPNLQLGHSVVASADFATTPNGWAALQLGGAAAFINTTTGAAGTASGCTSAVTSVGGRWRLTMTIAALATNVNTIIWLATADNQYLYNDVAGTGTVDVTNITVQQTQVSALGSIYGSAGPTSIAQAAAASWPQARWYYPSSGLYSPVNMTGQPGWYPVLSLDGVNDSLAGLFTMPAGPASVFCRWRWSTVPTIADIHDGGAGQQLRLFRQTSQSPNLRQYTAGSSAPDAVGPIQNTAWHTTVAVYRTGASGLYFDGVFYPAPNALSPTVTGLTLGSFGGGGNNASIDVAEIGVVGGASDTALATQYTRWSTATYPG